MEIINNGKISSTYIALGMTLLICLLILRNNVRNANEVKPVISGEGEVTIACVGDSITYGRGLDHRKKEAYPTRLQELLGDNYRTVNYGYSRRCAIKAADYPYVEEEYYKKSLELAADIYVIMLGTNDSKPYNWDESAYEADLKEMVGAYAATGAKIYLMQPPACFPEEKTGEVGYDINGEIVAGPIHEIVARVANDCEVSLIDLTTPTQDHPEWFYDGVHPNAEGATEIAKLVAAQISK